MSDLPSREEVAEAAAIAEQLRVYQHKGKTDCITYGNADPRVMLTILRMARLALSGRLIDREAIDYEAMRAEWDECTRTGVSLPDALVRIVDAALRIGDNDEQA
jgi:hypothetical protein